MGYTVTVIDMRTAVDAARQLIPEAVEHDGIDWVIEAQLKVALESLSAEIGVDISVPELQPIENKNGLPLDALGDLPTPLLFGVAVPYAVKATRNYISPVSSMSEGGDNVTFRDEGIADIRDYKSVYSRYKHLRTPERNKVV